MKRNKRYGKLLGLCVLLGLLVTGCGESDKSAVSEKQPQTTAPAYSRAEWIEDLGDQFGYLSYESETPIFTDVSPEQEYYAQVQACAEWGIITEQGTFVPGEAATWDYALNSAVRAIGTERLRRAGYEPEENALADFFLEHIASVQIADLGEQITRDEAAQVLSFAADFESGLQYEQVHEFVYQEGVQEVSEKDILLRGDGESAYLVGDKTYAEGSVLLYTNSETQDQIAIKVSSVEENLLWYTEATIDEVYESVVLQGTYEPEILAVSAIPQEPERLTASAASDKAVALAASAASDKPVALAASAASNEPVAPAASAASDKAVAPAVSLGTALYDSSAQGRVDDLLERGLAGAYYIDTACKVTRDIGSNKATFSVVGDTWKIEAGITNITAEADIDYSWFKLKSASVSVNFDSFIHGDMGGSVASTIPLGTITLSIYGTVKVEVDLILNLGADGNATLDYTSHMVAGATYEKGKGIRNRIENQNAALNMHADLTLTAEPAVKVTLLLIRQEILNASVTSGVVCIVNQDVDILGDQPACTDLFIYVPLRWAVNEDSCLATFLFGDKVRSSGVVWDATHSAFEWRWHYEDGVKVEACTRGAEEEIKAEPVDENNVPFDEYKVFAFEEIDFATIKLESYNLFLEKDETLKIGFREIPAGQDKDTLLYEVVDTQGVCSPNGDGTVTGIKPGAANIKISTPDGRYNAYITVIVQDDYSLSTEFDPL